MSSLDCFCSTPDSTSPFTITLPTYSDSTNSKSWFILAVSGHNTSGKVIKSRILCLVDLQEPVTSAAKKLEDLFFYSFGGKRAECELRYICPEGRNGEGFEYPSRRPFHASVEHLAVHLRGFGTTPSARLIEPGLWGERHNRLEVYFKKSYGRSEHFQESSASEAS